MIALSLAGCGGSASSTQRLPFRQQILRLGLVSSSATLATLDPAREFTGDFSFVSSLLFPPLITPDRNLQLEPWMTDSMPTTSPDGLTYTIQVKSGLKWSDGTSIDAGTYAYSINRSLNPCTRSGSAYYLYAIADAQTFNGESCGADGKTPTGPITTLIGDSITTPDPQTLVIKLAAPAPSFLYHLATAPAFAQPQQLIEPNESPNWTNALATGFSGGPYAVTNAPTSPNSLSTVSMIGVPHIPTTDVHCCDVATLREIDITFYKDATTAYTDYLAGNLSVGFPPDSQYQPAKARPNFTENPDLAINYVSPNWKTAPFDDLAARQAFAAAVDKNAIANAVFGGSLIPTNHIVPAGMPSYRNPNLTGVDGTQSLSANTTFAKQKMDNFATRKCPGGTPTSCPAVTFWVPTDATSEGQALLQLWQKALDGYPVTMKSVTRADLFKAVHSGNPPQLFLIDWFADYPDPQNFLSLQFAPESTYNTTFVNDPTGTGLMTMCDTTQQTKACNDAEQEMVKQVAWIPIGQRKVAWNVNKNVANFDVTPLGFPALSQLFQMYLMA
jgi:peptide/nickel transport system substrate-binding protein/oligopeptide transport system substrate-binding protein